MLKYHNGESIDIHYAKIFSRFSQSQEKIEKDISDMTRGQSLSRSIYMFNKIEADALREASEASQAAEAIALMSKRVNNGEKEEGGPVSSTIFKVAKDEAMERAEQLTLKYLAAVEARRAFEAETEEYNSPAARRERIGLNPISGEGTPLEHECSMLNGRCTHQAYHL